MAKSRERKNPPKQANLLQRVSESPYLSALVLLVAGVTAYASSFSGGFHLDDESSIVYNPAIKDLSAIGTIWHSAPTRFLTYLSFAVNYRLGGLDVFGYHVVNLALHIACGFAVWLLVRRILTAPGISQRGGGLSGIIPLLAAIMFVVHPIQTQAVTYVVQRATVLATLFYLLSVYFFLEARIRQGEHAPQKSVLTAYALSAGAGALGLLSKETILTLPFALVLVDAFFVRSKGINWKFFGAVLGVFLAFALIMIELNLVSLEDAPAINQIKYMSTQPFVMLMYLRLLFLPYDLNLDHDIPIAQSPFEPGVLLSLAVIITLLVVAWKLFRREPLLSFAIIWFFLVLLPESSVLPLADVMFEHRLYLPMFAGSLAIVVLIQKLDDLIQPRHLVLFTLVLAGVYAYSTFERNKVWKDEVTMWTDVVNKSPGKARGYNNLGRALGDAGREKEALAYFTRALAIDPANTDALNNRANLLVQNGNVDEAIADCNVALKNPPRLDYQLSKIYFNRGTAYIRKNQLTLALSDLDEALTLEPGHESAHFNRAIVYTRLQQYQNAIDDYTIVIRNNPAHAKAYNNRGSIYLDLGRLDEALRDFTQCEKIQPDYGPAYINEGTVLSMRGDLDAAIAAMTKGLEYAPRSAEGYFQRGLVYERKNDYQAALADFTRAIGLNGAFAQAYYERGRTYTALNDPRAAQSDNARARELGYTSKPTATNRATK